LLSGFLCARATLLSMTVSEDRADRTAVIAEHKIFSQRPNILYPTCRLLSRKTTESAGFFCGKIFVHKRWINDLLKEIF